MDFPKHRTRKIIGKDLQFFLHKKEFFLLNPLYMDHKIFKLWKLYSGSETFFFNKWQSSISSMAMPSRSINFICKLCKLTILNKNYYKVLPVVTIENYL